jgi:hypothetical protein
MGFSFKAVGKLLFGLGEQEKFNPSLFNILITAITLGLVFLITVSSLIIMASFLI